MTHGDKAPETDQQQPGASAAPRRTRAARMIGWMAVALAIAGWWVSYQLLLVSLEGAAASPFVTALCGDENTPGGCMSVLRSERAKVGSGGQAGAGFPWAGLGMGYFAFVGVWYLFVGVPDRSRRWWHLVMLIVVGCGAAASVDLTMVMKSELRTWCVGCLIVHGINGGLLLLSLAGFFAGRRAGTEARATAGAETRATVKLVQPTPGHALAALCAATAILVLHVTGIQLGMVTGNMQRMMQAYREIVEDADYVRWRHARETPVEIPLRDDEPWMGDPSAPNTVVAFIDFQCPVCKSAADVLKQTVDRHPDKLRVAFRHFPQDSICNPAYQRRGHLAACDAARAAEAARLLGGADAFGKMRAALYERQRDLELGRWREWAAAIGLDAETFEVNMRSPQVDERIREDTTLGGRLGVKAIPALYLNGRKLASWSRPETWDALLVEPSQAAP
jgi:protein-disulfide isomerase/uncharacterized membrane protein